eukprot:4899828-Pyramimonas_sp.AAC.1
MSLWTSASGVNPSFFPPPQASVLFFSVSDADVFVKQLECCAGPAMAAYPTLQPLGTARAL